MKPALNARIKRIRGSNGESAWLIEGTSLTIAEAVGNHETEELECELSLGEIPKPEPDPTEEHGIARTGITAT